MGIAMILLILDVVAVVAVTVGIAIDLMITLVIRRRGYQGGKRGRVP